jgi:hypothetical protein
MNLDEWKTLKSGQFVYSIKSGIKREIILFKKETLTTHMKSIRCKFDNVIYTKHDRRLFSLNPIFKNVISYCKDCKIPKSKCCCSNE